MRGATEKAFAIRELRAAVFSFLEMHRLQWVRLFSVNRVWYIFCHTAEFLKRVVFKPVSSATYRYQEALQLTHFRDGLQNVDFRNCKDMADPG